MIIRKKHKVCTKCGEFSNRWVYCINCGRMVCLKCAGDDNLCKDCAIQLNTNIHLDEYLKEKYKEEIKCVMPN